MMYMTRNILESGRLFCQFISIDTLSTYRHVNGTYRWLFESFVPACPTFNGFVWFDHSAPLKLHVKWMLKEPVMSCQELILSYLGTFQLQKDFAI